MVKRHLICGTGLCAVLFVCGTASAGFTNLGGGWQAEWDVSLDPFVDISTSGVVNTPNGPAIFIEKSAEFTHGSVNGVFPSIAVTFRQTAASNVEFIVIDDEIITNSTGEDWYDFHMQLLDSGDAVFRPDLTATSGGGGPIGWTISPFTQAAFSNNDEDLDIWGGVVPNGMIWRPGDQVDNGQLWIDVVSGPVGDFTLFTLKETPTPAPGALALMALAGVSVNRRRHRK